MTAAPLAGPRVWAGEPLEPHHPVPLPRFLLEHARDLGDKPALVDGPTGRTLSYRQLADGVERVAAGLAARGFGRGEALAISSPNLPEYALALYGAMAAGGAVTGANPLLTADELAGQLADAGASVLVTVPPFLETARAAAEKAGVGEVVVFGEADGATPFASLLGAEGPPPAVEIDPDRDLAVLPYSSGTTGLPKGVELTHANLVAQARQTQAVMGVTEDDVVVGMAPFFHAIGQSIILPTSLRAGATVVTMPRFDLAGFLGLIQEYRATFSIVVPLVVLALAGHPMVDDYDLSSLRLLGCGSAPLGADVEQRCADRLGCPVIQGFGMTEASAALAIVPPDAPRAGSAGRLLPGTEAPDRRPGRRRRPRSRPDRGAVGARPPGDARLPQPARGDGGHPGSGWLAAHRRPLLRRRRRLPVRGRPAQGAHQVQGHAGGSGRAGGAAVRPPGGGRRRRGAPARPRGRGGAGGACGQAVRGERGRAPGLGGRPGRPFKRLRGVRFVDQVPRSPTGKLLRRVLVEAERAEVEAGRGAGAERAGEPAGVA